MTAPFDPARHRKTSRAGAVKPLILFRSDTLAARAYLGRGSRLCFVVFDPMTSALSLDRPAFGESFLADYGYDAVHILASHNRWYQDPALPDVLKAVRRITRQHARVVTYGASMGGYAALRFAAPVGAHAVVALSPQYSVLPEAAPFERRWADLRRETRWLHEGPGDRLRPVAQATVLFDDSGLDHHHVAAILRDWPEALAVRVPHAGHSVVAVLREVGLLPPAVLDAAHGWLDPARLLTAIRQRRRLSGQVWFTLAHKQPPWRLRLKDRLAQRAIEVEPASSAYLSYAALVRDCVGRRDEALALHARAVRRPGFGLGEVRRARALWRAGQASEARAAAARAATLFQPNGPLLELCALMAAADHDPVAALAIIAGHPTVARFALLRRLLAALARLPLAAAWPIPASARGVALWLIRRTMLHPGRIGEELRVADMD